MRKAKQNHGVIEDRLYSCPAYQQIRDREIFWEYPSAIKGYFAQQKASLPRRLKRRSGHFS
jgi:hypothetical protein